MKDYGGPLVCQESNSKVIVGVSINGRGCPDTTDQPFRERGLLSGWIHKVFRIIPNSQKLKQLMETKQELHPRLWEQNSESHKSDSSFLI